MTLEIRIDLNADFKRVTASLSQFAEKQIPFAIATALNAIGKQVMVAEKAGIKKDFPTATPFTVNSVAQTKARKARLDTVIFVKDVAASYLAPYLDGGLHKLNSRALLNPKDIPLNQYGNIPRNALAALKGKSNVFIGPVRTKNGQTINGVWKRIPGKTGRKNKKTGKRTGATAGRLQLLVRFGDALPVRQSLPWGETAQKMVVKVFDAEFGKAMAKAIATARLK